MIYIGVSSQVEELEIMDAVGPGEYGRIAAKMDSLFLGHVSWLTEHGTILITVPLYYASLQIITLVLLIFLRTQTCGIIS